VFLAVLVVGLCGVALSEVAVRLLLPYNTPETLRAFSLEYEPSPFTRSRLAPANRLVEVDAAKGWGTKAAAGPSEQAYHINALGFRGPLFSPRKPAGTTRIVVLGGSSVFDQNVSDTSAAVGSSWPNRAQSILRARGFDAEVINAGTPGHSSADALGRLLSEIWLYEPDLVVLYSGWNDVKNFRATPVTPDAPLIRVIRQFDTTADPYRNYRGGWDRLLGSSQLYMKIRNAYLGATLPADAEGILPTGTVGSTYGEFGPRQYDQNLRNFVEIARNMGARPVLATEATLVLHPNPAVAGRIGDRYQLLDREGLTQAFEETYRRVRGVAAAKGAALFDAGAALNNDTTLFADHVHLTPRGSEALARLLADFLAPLIAAPAGSTR
jgi:lysophospholipase L1-like esterase